jgi:glutamate dehydrogenase (NADP+)
MYLDDVISRVVARNPGQKLFIQAVEEVLESLGPVIKEHPDIARLNIIERLTEPERQVMFRVAWVDDQSEVQVNRGYRVGFNSALGPYKGGLRFHPSVNISVIKFLAFEQIFKNSLTGLLIGGGKGGADFNPRGRSDGEIMRFCQSYMCELFRHIGDQTDVPAGDIGVGPREIGYLFGMYKKLTNRYELGTLTGKGTEWGGSHGRKEATGFGCVYFAREMLALKDESLEGKVCVVSGSGNVALYAIKKIQDLGGRVVACSQSDGVLFDPRGLDFPTLRMLKEVERERLQKYLEVHPGAEFRKGEKVWDIECEAAFPCATQNEILMEDAEKLVGNGCRLVCEGANMPTHPDALKVFQKAGVLFGPGKAANAGGVAVSAMEMQQNAGWQSWTFEDVDSQLRKVMRSIHDTCLRHSSYFGDEGNYVMGANIGGFLRIAEAMKAMGVV